MGEKTLNEYFYKPTYGAGGAAEKNRFDAALDVADAEIKANTLAKSGGLLITVKEENTRSITKGQPVYVSGSIGAAFPKVGLAKSDDSDKYEVIGLAAEDISQNQKGSVRTNGLLEGVASLGVTAINPGNETWVAADLLYLHTTTGGLTKTEPTVGRVIEVGYSLYGSSNTDAILLMIHSPHIHIEVDSGEDIVFRMGDSAGVNKTIFKGYDNIQVAEVDSNGKADFNELALDTPLPAIEGGTGKATITDDSYLKGAAGNTYEERTAAETKSDLDVGTNTVLCSNYDNPDDAITAISSANKTLLVTEAEICDNDFTVPANVTVKFERGGKWTINNGVTVTFNGSIDAGLWQIFAYISTGTLAGRPKIGKLYPEWWGAVGDGSTDDSTAIQAVFTTAGAIDSGNFKPTVCFSTTLGYGTSVAVICPSRVNIEMDSPIKYTGSSDIVALTVGETGTVNSGVKLHLKVIRSNQSDWTNDGNIGVKLFNPHTSNIWIDSVGKFTIGVQIFSEGAGAAYNNVWLSHIYNNKYGLDLYSSTAGWVNENMFYGGRFGVNTGVNTTTTRYGVRITSSIDYYNNSNVFIKPSFELNAADTTGEAVGMLVEYGINNRVIGCRDEGNDKLVKINNDSAYNIFEVAYGDGGITDDSTYSNNFVYLQKYHAVNADRGTLIFNSGSVHKKACFYDGSTSVNVPDVNLGSSSDATIYKAKDGITITPEYLQLTALGIFIKTTNQKEFIYRPDTITNYGGRLVIRAYDSGGSILTSGGGGHPYVTGQAFHTINWSAGFGGVYQTGADSNEDIFFRVGDDVDYICLLQTGGSAVLRTRGFSVFSVNGGNPATWVGYEEVVPGANIGITAPTAGDWLRGRTVFNSEPSSGGVQGWVCVTSGTPGTWVVLASAGDHINGAYIKAGSLGDVAEDTTKTITVDLPAGALAEEISFGLTANGTGHHAAIKLMVGGITGSTGGYYAVNEILKVSSGASIVLGGISKSGFSFTFTVQNVSGGNVAVWYYYLGVADSTVTMAP